MLSSEPPGNVCSRARLSLERGDPVGNAFIVDRRDRRRVGGRCRRVLSLAASVIDIRSGLLDGTSVLVILRLEPLHRARLGHGLSRLWLGALLGGFCALAVQLIDTFAVHRLDQQFAERPDQRGPANTPPRPGRYPRQICHLVFGLREGADVIQAGGNGPAGCAAAGRRLIVNSIVQLMIHQAEPRQQ